MNMPPLNASLDLWEKYLHQCDLDELLSAWSLAAEAGAQSIKHMTVMVCGYRLLGMVMKTRCLEKKMAALSQVNHVCSSE